MAQTLNINKYGGTVTFSATSDPAGPTLTYSTTGNTWVTRNGNVVTVAAYNGAEDRSLDITVTATTVTHTGYTETATASSAYTITQAGTGTTPTPTSSIIFNIAILDDAFSFYLVIKKLDGTVLYNDDVSNSDTITVSLSPGDGFEYIVTNNNSFGIYIKGDWTGADMSDGVNVAPNATHSLNDTVHSGSTIFYIQSWN